MLYRAVRTVGLLIVLATAVALSAGCVTTQSEGEESLAPSETSEALARATLQYAVFRAAAGDAERAATVAALAEQAIALAEGDDVTTAAVLETAMRDRIARADLSQDERMLVVMLADVVRSQIAQYIDENALSPDALVYVLPALQVVRDTARLVARPAAADSAGG